MPTPKQMRRCRLDARLTQREMGRVLGISAGVRRVSGKQKANSQPSLVARAIANAYAIEKERAGAALERFASPPDSCLSQGGSFKARSVFALPGLDRVLSHPSLEFRFVEAINTDTAYLEEIGELPFGSESVQSRFADLEIFRQFIQRNESIGPLALRPHT